MEQSKALISARIPTEGCAMQLLRLLGLKKDLNQSAFKACAEEVETWNLAYMGAEERSEALAAARQLVAELASNPALQGTSLYSSVRDIAFVPASLVRTDTLACLVRFWLNWFFAFLLLALTKCCWSCNEAQEGIMDRSQGHASLSSAGCAR